MCLICLGDETTFASSAVRTKSLVRSDPCVVNVKESVGFFGDARTYSCAGCLAQRSAFDWEVVMNIGLLKRFFSLSFLASSAFVGAGCAEMDSGDTEVVNQLEAKATAPLTYYGSGPLPNNANGFEGAPGVSMAGQTATLVLGRDKVTNRFRVSYIGGGPWEDFGSKAFSAKPAVAPLDGLYGSPSFLWSSQVAVVGLASDSRYYIRIGKLPAPGSSANPTLVAGHDWTAIPNTAYVSAPAVTVHSGTLVVAGRKSNNRLVLHSSVLAITNQPDFFTNVWGPTTAVPALPSGWVAQGDPAIASLGDANSRIILVTRAVNSGQKRLYATTWDRTSFSSWVSIPLTGVDLAGDPAVEYSSVPNTATVLVRGSDSRMYYNQGLTTWGTFAFATSYTFATSAGATGNLVDGSTHAFVAGASDNQFIAGEAWVPRP
jgi:hypothetical protein